MLARIRDGTMFTVNNSDETCSNLERSLRTTSGNVNRAVWDCRLLSCNLILTPSTSLLAKVGEEYTQLQNQTLQPIAKRGIQLPILC